MDRPQIRSSPDNSIPLVHLGHGAPRGVRRVAWCARRSGRAHWAGALRVALCLMLALTLFAFAGCKAGEVQKNLDKLSAQLDQAKAANEKVQAAIAYVESPDGVVATLDRIAAMLPGELATKLRDRVAQGRTVASALSEIMAELGAFTVQLQEQFQAKSVELAQRKVDDDATWEVIELVLGGVATFFGGGFFGRLLGIGRGVARGLAEGRQQGAAVVATSIQAGRAADPKLDDAFTGAGGNAARSVLSQHPDIADVVVRVKSPIAAAVRTG